MIKFKQSAFRVNIPKHNEGHIQQTHFQQHTQWEKTTRIPLKIRNKTGISAFTSHSRIAILATAIRKEEIKGIEIGKGGVKLSVFADDMILYIENPKDSTKKLL